MRLIRRASEVKVRLGFAGYMSVIELCVRQDRVPEEVEYDRVKRTLSQC